VYAASFIRETIDLSVNFCDTAAGSHSVRALKIKAAPRDVRGDDSHYKERGEWRRMD
jgi:hypothetical protein